MASKTVLVIDADSETEQFIASVLETEGYLVFAVPGGDVGAEMAQKVRPSLIFVNPEDTTEKGMEVCRTIRSYESLKTVPIILLSSGPVVADPGAYGVVDSLSLPASEAELLEKTEKAIDVKSAVVVRVREKTHARLEDEMPAGSTSSMAQEGAVPQSRLSDLSEIAEMEESGDVRKEPQKDLGEASEFSYFPEEEPVEPRKSKKALVALLAVLVIVVAAAGTLYYTGMIPGIGLQPKALAPLPATVEKAEKPEAPSAAEPEKQPVAADKTASAPVVATTRPGATEEKAAAAPAAAKAVPAAKPSGKAVYSVQVGAFSSGANAEALVKKLIEKGYDAFTLKSSVKDKGTVYRVLIGKFEDRKKARETAGQIRKKENLKPVIFSE